MVLLLRGLQALKKVAKQVSLDLRGAYLNLDAGFDSTHNRKCIKRPKRGWKRLFNEAIHALRTRVDRTFAWEDKFKRLLLRFEHLQQRHFGMKLLAYTLINGREFCGA
jgi:transposase